MKLQTERSREENQERAYIAASRRTDRSIEARVKSARIASEIHKRRTGKGLKISREIVTKENMYEEEEDHFSRQYCALTAQLHASTTHTNSGLNQVATVSLTRYDEINRKFSEQFSGAAMLLQQMAQSRHIKPLRQHESPHLHQTSFQTNQQSREGLRSVEQSESISPRKDSRATTMPQPGGAGDDITSLPALCPDSPNSQSTPPFSPDVSYPTTKLTTKSSLEMSSVPPLPSPVQLRQEVDQIDSINPNDLMTSMFFERDIMPLNYIMEFIHSHDTKNTIEPPELETSLLSDSARTSIELSGQCSTIEAPNECVGDDWEAWINDDG